VVEMDLKLDPEKFLDAPPPYEALSLTKRETKAQEELPDSGFSDSQDTTDVLSRSGNIAESCIEPRDDTE